jgi:hypothetical protein
MTVLTFQRLRDAIAQDAAIRRIQRLQPAGGPGDKIFPPTYPRERTNDSARQPDSYNILDLFTLRPEMLDQQKVPLELKYDRCVGERTYVPLIRVMREGCPGTGYPGWQRSAHSLSRLRSGGPETRSGETSGNSMRSPKNYRQNCLHS